MKKKTLMSIVLLAIIGTSAVFAQAPTLDKLRFLDDKNGGYEVAAKDKKTISGEVVIPDTYNGKPVRKLFAKAFEDSSITSVIIPNSVNVIGSGAFTSCVGLTSVTIPASVTKIEHSAFIGWGKTMNLTSVTFQGSNITMDKGVRTFDGDLDAKYQAGGAGTYTRDVGGKVWTKVGGVALCPTCGQPLPAGFKLP